MKIKYVIYLVTLHMFDSCYSDNKAYKCGTIDDSIVGDLRAHVPWMAVIFRKNAEDCNWTFWKTGSIIGPSTIIMSGRHFWNISTPMHDTIMPNFELITFRPSDFLVGVGVLSDDFREADFYSHYFKVEYITPHAESHQKYSSFDMALVHLKTPIKFSPYVKPLCIADKSYSSPTSKFASIVSSTSLKAGFSSDGGFQKLYKNPVVLDSYPLDSNCSIELKRKTNLGNIVHGDLPVKRCVDLDAGLAVFQLGAWYLTSVAVGGFDPSPFAKSLEEWYFFSPLNQKQLSWVENSMLCGPGNTACYKEKCLNNCKLQENVLPPLDHVNSWFTDCSESGRLESDNDIQVNVPSSTTTSLPIVCVTKPSEEITATSSSPITATSSSPITATSSSPITATSSSPITATSSSPITATSISPITATSSSPITATSSSPITATSRSPITATSSSPVTTMITQNSKLDDHIPISNGLGTADDSLIIEMQKTCKLLIAFSIDSPMCKSIKKHTI